jgi:hypothetical protein
MERSIENLPFGLLGNEGSERPTGGLVDAPSSKAVEEGDHFQRNCTLGERRLAKRRFLKFRAQRGNPMATKNLRTRIDANQCESGIRKDGP